MRLAPLSVKNKTGICSKLTSLILRRSLGSRTFAFRTFWESSYNLAVMGFLSILFARLKKKNSLSKLARLKRGIAYEFSSFTSWNHVKKQWKAYLDHTKMHKTYKVVSIRLTVKICRMVKFEFSCNVRTSLKSRTWKTLGANLSFFSFFVRFSVFPSQLNSTILLRIK